MLRGFEFPRRGLATTSWGRSGGALAESVCRLFGYCFSSLLVPFCPGFRWASEFISLSTEEPLSRVSAGLHCLVIRPMAGNITFHFVAPVSQKKNRSHRHSVDKSGFYICHYSRGSRHCIPPERLFINNYEYGIITVLQLDMSIFLM